MATLKTFVHLLVSWWNNYKQYVCDVILAENENNLKGILYLRDELFCKIITYFLPISILPLVPGIYLSFKVGMPIVGVADIISFIMMLVVAFNRKLTIKVRKVIFLTFMYCLSVVLLFYINNSNPGMLYLLFLTAITSLIYSPKAAYWSAFTNLLVCISFSFMLILDFKVPYASNGNSSDIAWIAISSNLVALSFICAGCLNHLISGIEKSIDEKNTSQANLSAVIENSKANIYSIDRDFKYVTFNQVLKNNLKQTFNVDIKTGDKVFEFLGSKDALEEEEWRNNYMEALQGKSLQFEKEFNQFGPISFVEFSINPIIENNTVIGLSCFAVDVTNRKLEERERVQISKNLIHRNTALQQFTYIISHNLRAPIANIMGIGYALKVNLTSEKREELQRHLFLCIDKLDGVVKDLNTILVAKSDVMENKQKVFFRDIVEDVKGSLSAILENDRVEVSTDFKVSTSMVTIKSYLYSVFYNLIYNSIKYKQPYKQVLIEIKSVIHNGNLQLHFKDNGLGIDLKLHGDKIFGLYKRFHLNIEGKGMGLFMVKTQVEVLGGKINVKSEPQIGTEFIIEFDNEIIHLNKDWL